MAERITLRQATLKLLDNTEPAPNTDALGMLRHILSVERRQMILLDEIAQRTERLLERDGG